MRADCERVPLRTRGRNHPWLWQGADLLERDTSNTAKFYTRLFPVGSTRNIDAEKYGSPRLMLPGGRKYIEQGVEEYGIYDHYEQDAFSGIFPVGSVR